ncbi:fibronectin type III domain-containing protein [Candidatus Kaiserbacteria bacterium]|nr:fibronectin type III domain-containing protein [Candidatus Kaiserbacteria bacterium]MCB9811714.1 fibronectin type III domain-containing protein [Candidatus Nomurabacteria bacterium]
MTFAVSGDFNIRVQVGDDTEAPTTPANVTATPISTDQIDLDWDDSTDNLVLSGYQVFRDGLQIATTTVSSYADSGLTADTLYSYYVTAFDNSYNVSSSSVTVATSTLPVVVATSTATSSSHNYGSYIPRGPVEVENFQISSSETTAVITFDTNVYTKLLLRWGRTPSYELGYIGSDAYKTSYRTLITDLEPGTTYELELRLTERFGVEEYVKRVSFTTDNGPDTVPPANVWGLTASLQNDGSITLNWQNPHEPDFSHVRVVGSNLFYPAGPYDGWIVYEGEGTSVRDPRTDLGRYRYYSVFSYDTSGNISSGAVVMVDTDPTAPPELPSESLDTSFDLFMSDLQFWQSGSYVSPDAETIALKRGVPFTVSLPYGVVPEHLKTIVVTFHHPVNTNQIFSFILRINHDKTAYEATIGGLETLGYYPSTLELYDYETRTIKRAEGQINVISEIIPQIKHENKFLVWWFLWPVILLVLLLLILLRSRSRG